MNRNKKNSKEFMDQDYIEKLSPEERAFMAKFNDEYYNGSFKNDSTDIHTKEADKRDIWKAANARNRDFYAPTRYHSKSEKPLHKDFKNNQRVGITTTGKGLARNDEERTSPSARPAVSKSGRGVPDTESILVTLLDHKRRQVKKPFYMAVAA